jgi:hypothetical protein
VKLILSSKKSTVSGRYIFIVGATSFLLAVVFFWLSDILATKLHNLILSFLFLFLVIIIGIIADIIGTSVATVSEVPFHAKSAKKVFGAQEGLYLIRNADRVANICSDVIGDIAGTLSGAMGIALAVQILLYLPQVQAVLLNMLITGVITALTIAGKAKGKSIALSRSSDVIFFAGRLLAVWGRLTGVMVVKKANRVRSR